MRITSNDQKLTYWTGLTRLSLLMCSHDRLGDETIISEFARNNPLLRSAYIGFEQSPLTPLLTEVDLSYAKLSIDTLVALCRSCPKLESLVLRVCDIVCSLRVAHMSSPLNSTLLKCR